MNRAESAPAVSLSGDNRYARAACACPQYPYPCAARPAFPGRESGIICLTLSESVSSSACPFSLSMEGHPKEVIPIPLSFLCLLSEGLCG